MTDSKKAGNLKKLSGGIRLLYEDTDIIVCHKPSGIPVQSASMRVKDMVSILKLYRLETELCRDRTGQAEPYIGVVHRLDQPVQGVIVFAKTKKAGASLSAQMAGGRDRQAEKQYRAVVCGKPECKEGELVDYLLKDGRTNTSRIVSAGTKGAKESRLVYQVLEEREGCSLLNIRLLTGRHHQIRVQLADAGMPVAGDRKYNPSAQKEQLALCAYRLTFRHPENEEKITFQVEPEGGAFDKFR